MIPQRQVTFERKDDQTKNTLEKLTRDVVNMWQQAGGRPNSCPAVRGPRMSRGLPLWEDQPALPLTPMFYNMQAKKRKASLIL